jgi:hypothetical protein
MPRGAPLPACALALALVLAFAAAGCGGGSKPYTATGTASCLRTKGFTHVTTDPGKVGFVAGFADNGGLQARWRTGNVVTIAFAGDASGVPGTEKAFREHASGVYKRHLQDVMSATGNAVLVWTVTPSRHQLAVAVACLHA